ncbi:alpha/beta hydrolase family protein [Sphingobacterium ginsenosidimutans]|uniref:Acetyl xylan esterase domain-containing protein n=1 Tax=Sphingobacterium ginsenosidimutans TaxID=687845 RepID=A0ABP8A9B7_9SPHI
MNFKLYTVTLMMTFGQQVAAQTALPEILSIPKDIDPLKELIESQADELLYKLPMDRIVDPEQLLNQIHTNLQLGNSDDSDLDMRVVASLDCGGYTVYNLIFQSLPGVYVPANLYVPKGQGPFPAILNSHGHWAPGRRSEIVQRTSQILASNGYVCLSIDAMGAGERGRRHEHEYHGANLGSLLLDMGTPLMGIQLQENKRAIDLLCSLDYVNKEQIGATGASGGGNQTMWLTAMDARVKAAVPVVSVGTFRSYIMNSNCVCELHPNGLQHFEEGQLLQAMAPKAVKIITALKDGNAAFNVHQMLKSYRLGKLAYQQQDSADRLAYELFDESHSYTIEMNKAMLSWFNKSFNYRQSLPIELNAVHMLDTSRLSVLQYGIKSEKIMTIPAFVNREFKLAENKLIITNGRSTETYLQELRLLLSKVESDRLLSVRTLLPEAGWRRIILETAQRQLIPLLVKEPAGGGQMMHVLFPDQGKQGLNLTEIDQMVARGEGIAIVDLFGLGERASASAEHIDGALPRFHTISRSMLWMGQTMMGIWANEITLVSDYLQQHYGNHKMIVHADRETALAALISSDLSPQQRILQLRRLPASYLPDMTGSLENFNMAVHIPGILKWGDIPLLLALSREDINVDELMPWSGKSCPEKDKKQLLNKVNAYKRKFNIGGTLQIN